MRAIPYEGQINTETPAPPTDTTLKGEVHVPPPPVDSTPQFEAPATTGLRLRHFLGPVLITFLILAIIVGINPFGASGPNPLLGTTGNGYAALLVQFILIFIGLQILEFLFSLTGSPLFLWGAFMAVVAFFFGMMYFFDRNFFDPSYKLSLGPLPLIWETVKTYLSSPL